MKRRQRNTEMVFDSEQNAFLSYKTSMHKIFFENGFIRRQHYYQTINSPTNFPPSVVLSRTICILYLKPTFLLKTFSTVRHTSSTLPLSTWNMRRRFPTVQLGPREHEPCLEMTRI